MFKLFSIPLALAVSCLTFQAQAQDAQKPDTVEVLPKDQGLNCPVSVEIGKIIGLTHAEREGTLGGQNVNSYYTLFSIADKNDTLYTVRAAGILHAADFAGVIVKSACRETSAGVVELGAPKKKN